VTTHSPRKKHTGLTSPPPQIKRTHFEKFEIQVESAPVIRKTGRPGKIQTRFDLGSKSTQKFEMVLCDLEKAVDESIKQQEKKSPKY
jgi:hypothetical protein